MFIMLMEPFKLLFANSFLRMSSIETSNLIEFDRVREIERKRENLKSSEL